MDNKKNLVLTIVIAIIAIGSYFFPTNRTVVERVTEQLGISAGPESTNDYQCYAGVCTYYRRQVMRTATTTPCALRAPSATSSLIGFMFQINTATSVAATIDIGTSTDPFSTTSPQIIKAFSVAANAKATVQTNGTTTSNLNTNAQNNLIGPNNYVVMKTAGAGEGGYTYGGVCTAIFQTAQ